MRKLKIAHVTNLAEAIPPKNKAGLEQMVFYLTEELVKLGHEVTIFGTEDSQTSANLIPLWPRGFSNDPNTTFTDPQTFSIWAVAEAFLHADEFDIIHDHTHFVAGHFAGSISTPVVCTVHHTGSYGYDTLQALPTAHQHYLNYLIHSHHTNFHLVCVSHAQRQQMLDLFGLDSYVVHNGISQPIVTPNKTHTHDYLAFLGYISGNKGVSQAIQATLRTSDNLIIAGPVDLHDTASQIYFEQEVKPYVDGNKIKYIGPLDMNEKINFLSQAKAVLMPIQWDEPFGLVAIEALACGTPVIAFNRGALPEIIENGKTGFIVDTIEDMASKINQIEQLSRPACTESYEKSFTATRMAHEYEKIYYKLVNKK